MSNTPDVVLQRYAELRFQQFYDTPLNDLSTPSDAFCEIPGAYIKFLVQNSPQICQWLDGHLNYDPERQNTLVSFFTMHMLRYMYAKNQFFDVDDRKKQDLTALYLDFLLDFRTLLNTSYPEQQLSAEFRQVMAVHQSSLAVFVQNLITQNRNWAFYEPVCSEYSPEIQLSILQTQLSDLTAPVLDLGCGTEGKLVDYLHKNGITAFGLDRVVDQRPHLIQADWFEYAFGTGQWGTIISHMALSNHFLHHHFSPDGHPEQYAYLYMRILNALKPGGEFLYTPGLPFIEDMLPEDRYWVERKFIPELRNTSVDTSLRGHYGTSVFYATKIIKRPVNA